MAHDFEKLAAGVTERVIAWQRTIHADPEVGFDTVRTAALVAKALREVGVSVREGIGRTGVVGDIDVPSATRRLAFRADMDALPMDEENDLPHKSRNPGAAHMCGHDAHTSMLWGAAHVLSGMREELQCSVRFIFQPNEETVPGGITHDFGSTTRRCALASRPGWRWLWRLHHNAYFDVVLARGRVSYTWPSLRPGLHS